MLYTPHLFNPEYVLEVGPENMPDVDTLDEFNLRVFMFYKNSKLTGIDGMQFLAWKQAGLDVAGELEIQYIFNALSRLNELYSDYSEYLSHKQDIKQQHREKHGTRT